MRTLRARHAAIVGDFTQLASVREAEVTAIANKASRPPPTARPVDGRSDHQPSVPVALVAPSAAAAPVVSRHPDAGPSVSCTPKGPSRQGAVGGVIDLVESTPSPAMRQPPTLPPPSPAPAMPAAVSSQHASFDVVAVLLAVTGLLNSLGGAAPSAVLPPLAPPSTLKQASLFQPARYRNGVVPALLSAAPLCIRKDDVRRQRFTPSDVDLLLRDHPEQPEVWMMEREGSVAYRRAVVNLLLTQHPMLVPANAAAAARDFAHS